MYSRSNQFPLISKLFFRGTMYYVLRTEEQKTIFTTFTLELYLYAFYNETIFLNLVLSRIACRIKHLVRGAIDHSYYIFARLHYKF